MVMSGNGNVLASSGAGRAAHPTLVKLRAQLTYTPPLTSSTAPVIPLGRKGRTEEIAWPIAFLCSPAASYITGAVLDVNGGVYVS
jgi:NAD(P)-dependent dehydrogenase (short-subunit alcohol dehydrogenase family)